MFMFMNHGCQININMAIKRLIMVSILEKIQKAYALFLSDRIVVPSKHASEKASIFGMTKKNSSIQICLSND